MFFHEFCETPTPKYVYGRGFSGGFSFCLGAVTHSRSCSTADVCVAVGFPRCVVHPRVEGQLDVTRQRVGEVRLPQGVKHGGGYATLLKVLRRGG